MEKTAASEKDEIVSQVREKYAEIAKSGSSCCELLPSSCCGGSTEGVVSLALGYDTKELEGVPEEANLGLGCGAPIDHLALQPGETVLDLGSGPGLDAFLAARRVGPTGHVIGVDMTPEMLERARASATKAGLSQVEFREGRLEALPVEDASVDAVTSNCVINLVPDKEAVFREIARVLKPGGRLVISDIILDGRLPEAIEKDLYAYVGCISGAMERGAYFAKLDAAGLAEVKVLHDIDTLAAIAQVAPEEARSLLERTGTDYKDIAGKVHSVTFRAVKPAFAHVVSLQATAR